MRNPYVSFTYWFPLTSSRTGGGPAGFAGAGAGAATVAGDFAAATSGAFFVVLGAAEVDEGVVEAAVVAGALAEFAVVTVDAGAVAGLLGIVAVGAEDAGGVFADSFFAVFAGLAAAAGAGATAVSVLAGFGGATGFSAAGSGFFSLSDFAGASDMLMVAT